MLRNSRWLLSPEDHESSASVGEALSSGAKRQLSFAHDDMSIIEHLDQIVPVAPGQMEDLETMIDMPDNIDWVGYLLS
jgi:hypothetical protein